MARRSLTWGFAFCAVVGPAYGQVPPPSTAEPGRIDERFQRPIAPESVPRTTIQIPTEPSLGLPEGADQSRFVLQGINIEGSTVFSDEDLARLYAPVLQREVSLGDMYKLRDRITAKYRGEGYILSQALVPPQRIENGVVRIRVVEGSISKVSVDGVAANDTLVVSTANSITRSRPLKASDLERVALLIGDIPGISVQTTLRPSETPGSADLVVSTERKALDATLFADNRGSRAIGPFEFGGTATLNGVAGPDALSVLVASASPTRELRYISGRYQRVLSASGLKFDLSASSSRSHPGGALSALAALGTGTIITVGLDQPLIRSRSRTLRVNVSFTVQNTRTDLLATTFARDHVRYLTAGFTFDVSDTLLGSSLPASNLFHAELAQGLDIIEPTRTGSANLSRANGRSDFTLAVAEVNRVQRLGGPLSVALGASGQVGFVPLLSSQQFGLGGKRFGRGYEPSELTGDSGIAFSIEPRVDLPVTAANLQLYGFYDVGKVWDRRPLPGTPSSRSLSSAGGGVRASIGSHVSLAFEMAKPLTRDIASRGNRHWRPLFDASLHF